MDNREAMIAAFEKWASNDGKYPNAIQRNMHGQYLLMQTCAAWITWERAWSECQAATAHNRDAVIDECVNFLKSQIENINDGSIASALDIYVDHLSESLRSLKTNKEG